jgi:hypothetical protein
MTIFFRARQRIDLAVEIFSRKTPERATAQGKRAYRDHAEQERPHAQRKRGLEP